MTDTLKFFLIGVGSIAVIYAVLWLVAAIIIVVDWMKGE